MSVRTRIATRVTHLKIVRIICKDTLGKEKVLKTILCQYAENLSFDLSFFPLVEDKLKREV